MGMLVIGIICVAIGTSARGERWSWGAVPILAWLFGCLAVGRYFALCPHCGEDVMKSPNGWRRISIGSVCSHCGQEI
jgi:hypothetical protein